MGHGLEMTSKSINICRNLGTNISTKSTKKKNISLELPISENSLVLTKKVAFEIKTI